MQLDQANLFNEFQSMRTELGVQGLQNDQALQGPLNINANAPAFGDLLAEAIQQVNGLQKNSNHLRTQFDMGNHNVSIGDVMIASQKSSVAFDATVEVRNKLVDAYKQISSMPV